MQKPKTGVRRRKTQFINVQRSKASCGPIAVANLIKWHGFETSYKKTLRFCMQLRAYHPRVGMWPFQLRYILRTLQINFRVHKRFSIAKMDALLDSGGSCILIYDTKLGSHAVFLDRKEGRTYRAWNKSRKRPYFTRLELKKAMQNSTRAVGGLYVYTFPALKT